MKQTSVISVLSLGLIGGVVMWGVEWLLVSLGHPLLVPPVSWSVVLWLISAVVVALAWPIRARLNAKTRHTPVDPFYATRVVLLAKASSLTGGGLAGAAIGVLVFLATRPVISQTGLWLSVAALLGAIVLMVAGVIAEKWCMLPPDSSDTDAIGLPEGEPG
jgi:hypothetical protein